VRVTQRDPEAASPGRRVLASCIDAPCILSALAGTMGGVARWGRREDDRAGGRLPASLDRWNAWSESPRWQRTGTARAVALRNWPSLGMHVMHIHSADARTGGPVTVRSALTRHLVEQARGRLVKELMAPWRRNQERTHALRDEIKAAQRQYRDDRQAQLRAVMEVYRAAGVSPMSGCWVPVLPVAVDALVTLSMPRHQSVSEWLAGIVVVRD
jgi:hypothetical protein